MLSIFSREKARKFGLVVLAALMIAAVPIFPGVRSNALQEERYDVVSSLIKAWLTNNKLWEKQPVNFEIFYIDGVKENARYELNTQNNQWVIKLDPASQRSYVAPYSGGEAWGCPGTTVSDAKPTGYWQWQGACVGAECSYGSPLFIVTGWESSGGVMQNCA